MKPQLPNTISDKIPNFYRVRGGTLMEVLLERIDHNWCHLGSVWSDLLDYGNCEAAIREFVDLKGWAYVMTLADSRIAHPNMLAEITSSGPSGSDASIRFWLKCLFDWDVESVSTQREIGAAANPTVKVLLSRPFPKTDIDLAIDALRAICPAHLEVNESSVVWIEQKGAK